MDGWIMLSYALLAGSIMVSFLPVKKSYIWGILGASLLCALGAGVVDPVGCAELMALALNIQCYFKADAVLHHVLVKTMAKTVSFLGIVLTFEMLLHHKLPGFHNFCALSGVSTSPSAIPYTMWFNFDRTFAAMVLAQSIPSLKSLIPRPMSWSWFGGLLALCVVGLSSLGCITGYVALDFKWPECTTIWCVNNLLFVCFAEEIFFRAFLQTQFYNRFPMQWCRYGVPIVASAICFGIDHAVKSGPMYGIFTLIAGLFYGYIYQRWQKILYAILFHFLLNLIHFIFLTYPASIAILKWIQ